jgi:predicted metal-binding membrane protein
MVIVSVMLFVVSTALTIGWCTSMAAMPAMPMPGDWAMTTAWMRMPGQTWLGAAASFLAMWVVMMPAMMMPTFIPVLQRYQKEIANSGAARGLLLTIVSLGYFSVWTAAGAAVFPLGTVVTTMEMHHAALARAVPAAMGVIVLCAGALQFTAWKGRCLGCCRESHLRFGSQIADSATAWRHGVWLGLDCLHCCANLMVILLVTGVMDLRAMGVVGAAITAERLLPAGSRVAQTFGTVFVSGGLLLIVRATGLA